MTMTDLFISYSHEDTDFVRTLHQALQSRNYHTWVDWKDIPVGAQWQDEVREGIERAHTFIFVISPDSICSPYCKEELQYAASHHKRIIPILRRELPEEVMLPPELSKIQYLNFREQDAPQQAIDQLVETIKTDLDHRKLHTELEKRAIEWLESGKDRNRLLRRRELNKAEQEVLEASVGNELRPTKLQQEYIRSSRKVYANLKKMLLGVLFVLLFLIVWDVRVAILQAREERRQQTVKHISQYKAQNKEEQAKLYKQDVAISQLPVQIILRPVQIIVNVPFNAREEQLQETWKLSAKDPKDPKDQERQQAFNDNPPQSPRLIINPAIFSTIQGNSWSVSIGFFQQKGQALTPVNVLKSWRFKTPKNHTDKVNGEEFGVAKFGDESHFIHLQKGHSIKASIIEQYQKSSPDSLFQVLNSQDHKVKLLEERIKGLGNVKYAK